MIVKTDEKPNDPTLNRTIGSWIFTGGRYHRVLLKLGSVVSHSNVAGSNLIRHLVAVIHRTSGDDFSRGKLKAAFMCNIIVFL